MRRAKKPALRGTARRVIVVPQPRESAFEQAIFVLRPDAPHISEAELLGTEYTEKNTEVYNDFIVIGEAVNNSPQVAARADRHFCVIKHVEKERTFSESVELDREGRIREIARMLGGGGSALARLRARLPRVALDSSPRTVAMFNVMFLYICASLATLQSPGMMRLIWVFWIGPICMLPYVCEKIIAGGGRSFFKALIILYFIAAFWLFAVRFDFGEMLHYRTFLF